MPGPAATRALAAAQTATGAALVVAPGAVAHALTPIQAPPTWLARVLGGRILVQGVVVLLCPTRIMLLTGAAADAAHGLSMLAAASGFPAYRRAALVSAALASASAAAAVALSRTLAPGN
jgi:hypothetical protein